MTPALCLSLTHTPLPLPQVRSLGSPSTLCDHGPLGSMWARTQQNQKPRDGGAGAGKAEWTEGWGQQQGGPRAAWAQHHRARGGSISSRPLPVTGSSLSHTQGPQVGPLHLGLSRLTTKHVHPAPWLCYLLPQASTPSFLLPPPLEPGGLSSALSLSHAHELSFLSVSDSATPVTFLLSRGSLPAPHCPFSPGLSLSWGTL